MSALILVADDDPQILATLTRILTGACYRVATASDGRVAIELARAAAPDLVVSDLDMPKLTGLQLLTELKSDPGLASIPVLILTAQTDASVVQQLVQAGAVAVLSKPATAQEILSAVRLALTK